MLLIPALGCVAAPTGGSSLGPSQEYWHDDPSDPLLYRSRLGPSWTLWPQVGSRAVLSGDRDRILESTALQAGICTGPTIGVGSDQSLTPYFLLLYSRPELDGGGNAAWDVYDLGLGIRYALISRLEYDVYALGDISHGWWNGRGDGGSGTQEPRSRTGGTIGIGAGGTYYATDVIGIGLQFAYRSLDASRDLRVDWLDSAAHVTLRF